MQLLITNTYINDYHTIFCHIASKIELQEGMPLIDAINDVNSFIETNFSEQDLKRLNDRYNMDVSYNISDIKENINKIKDQINCDKYIPINEYLNKKVLETTRFLRSIDRFNEDVFRHYKLNCNMPMSKKEKLIMLSNYDIPMIFNYILQNFNYRMTKNDGLCLIKKEKNLREREIKIGINLLKCRDKVNSFFKLPQINECLGYFSIPKVNFTAISDCDNILKSSENFWKIITSTQIPMAYSLMYGNRESDKTLLYFESSENFNYKNSENKKLEDPNLGKYYLRELRHGGEVNCFSMINNVSINMNEKGDYEDSLYFCDQAKCMIGVRKKSKEQSIWVLVENQKLLKDKEMFLNNLRNGKLDFDFVFMETQRVFKYTNSIPDIITNLNKQAIEDMNKLDSLNFFEKIKRLKNDNYWYIFNVRYQKLKNLYRIVNDELNYYSSNNLQFFRKNMYFDINTIFGLDFNNEERKEVLGKLKEEIAIQMRNNEIFGILEKYQLYIPENESVQVNGAFFVQLTNLYKTLEYGDTFEKTSIVLDNIIDKLLEYYEQLEYNINADYSIERNVPIVAYPIIVSKLCDLFDFNKVNPKDIISLSSFIDFIKMVKSKTNVEVKGKC